MSDARARVDAFLDAAARATRPRPADELLHRLAVESGLSVGGARHAIAQLLEVDAHAHERAGMIEHAADAGGRPAIAVILASNVFTAPLRAIAWALARAPRVVVRASRRAWLFPATLASHCAGGAGAFELLPNADAPERDLDALLALLPASGEVHAYGGDDAIASIAGAVVARTDLSLEAHGSGFGAIVASSDAIVASADAIALDVAAFDQRGCLSPRIAFVLGDHARAADALHEALARVATQLPRGTLDARELGQLRLACDVAAFHGRALIAADHAVLDLGAVPGAPIGPIGRVLPLVSVASVEEAALRLAPIEASLTVVAIDRSTLGDRPATLFGQRVRATELGSMQRPPLSIGPVDARRHPRNVLAR